MKSLIFTVIWLFLAIHYQTETIPGDINGDLKVDFDDFAIMASHWLQSADCEPNVTQEWVARYNGPANYQDYAYDIAIDTFGNVYVTGGSRSATSEDYATIKYDSNGNELWVARYNGPSNRADVAEALAIDSSGNVYVTGRSEGSVTSYDYTTIKYDPNGSELWVAKYNGPGNDRDRARAIAIDDSSNIYVTGRSEGYGTNLDYATIKYAPDSNESFWVARYNGPGNSLDEAFAIAIDSNNNVYVTGYSVGYGTGRDYATVKYDPNGNELWVARYNRGSDDYAYAIAIDSSDSVSITGRSNGYGTSRDYATIKYDPNGNELWVARYNGPANSSDSAGAIAIDSNDNVYVTGGSYDPCTNQDWATIKYDPNGNELWVARYNGPGNSDDHAYAIAIDSSDSVYVTGLSRDWGTEFDYTTIKYDANGNEIWVARYNGPANSNDSAWVMAIDSSDNVYVTGRSAASGTSDDYATIKYSPTCICTNQIPGDFTNDCKVDFNDLDILATHWLENPLDLVFIHHSVGYNWLNDSLHNALLAKDYIDERNDIYYGTDLPPDISRPDSLGPTTGDKTDMNHWILWFNDYLSAVKTHECSDGVNKIIMFKSCYPNSNITSDGTEPGDPFSSQKTITNYRAVYRHPAGPNNVYSYAGYTYKPLEDIFAENPDTLFIPVTAPPRHYAPFDATNDAEADRARVFNNWLKNDWLASYNAAHPKLNNVAVFDWFDLLAYPDDHPTYPNRLKVEYGGESGDSHPNDMANSYSTYIFATCPYSFIDKTWNAFVPNP